MCIFYLQLTGDEAGLAYGISQEHTCIGCSRRLWVPWVSHLGWGLLSQISIRHPRNPKELNVCDCTVLNDRTRKRGTSFGRDCCSHQFQIPLAPTRAALAAKSCSQRQCLCSVQKKLLRTKECRLSCSRSGVRPEF